MTTWLHRRVITDLVMMISVTTYRASDGSRTHTGNIPARLKVWCHNHLGDRRILFRFSTLSLLFSFHHHSLHFLNVRVDLHHYLFASLMSGQTRYNLGLGIFYSLNYAHIFTFSVAATPGVEPRTVLRRTPSGSLSCVKACMHLV